MAEGSLPAPSAQPVPSSGRSAWGRISPALVPILAVITALLIGIPFMVITAGRGDISRGLAISSTAYSALIEGSIGLAFTDTVSRDDFSLVQVLIDASPLTQQEVRTLARSLTDLEEVGLPDVRRYAEVLARYPSLSDEQILALGDRIPVMVGVGEENLRAMLPLIADLDTLESPVALDLLEPLADLEFISPEERAAIEAALPSAVSYSDIDLLRFLKIIGERGVNVMVRSAEQLVVLDELGMPPDSVDANDIAAITLLSTTATPGSQRVRNLSALEQRLADAGIFDPIALSGQLRVLNALYEAELLTSDDVNTALTNELDEVVANNLLIRRPAPVLLRVDPGTTAASGVVYDRGIEADTADDRVELLYLRAGGGVFLFYPGQLEGMLVRAIPFIIAGLAVALGFKAGLFNIGAEGQLYMGATLAAVVGFGITGLPLLLHLPLVIVAGLVGGALWGSIPGLLKAYTGAHEVIVTIMMNFIAIRLVDWLIKARDPFILRDPVASTDQTPMILDSARLPTFNSIPLVWFVAIGILFLLLSLWNRREQIREDIRYAIRPIVNGLLIIIGGIVLSALSVEGRLHLGLVVMLLAVWFTDWFLTRTTLGFELRTVGSNSDAARYAGMSVTRNIVMAMALSGALAGLAGASEISGVSFNMKPEFFAGVGFDAIAVALLARSNPRNMIASGLLWGALYSGAGMMQARANISIDLVKIIQALIIMFIAADAIIRYLWRIPLPSKEVEPTTTFSKGWGG